MLHSISLKQLDRPVVHFYGNGDPQFPFRIFGKLILGTRQPQHLCRTVDRLRKAAINLAHASASLDILHIYFIEICLFRQFSFNYVEKLRICS
ncbi:hypothetical protein DSECCO2_661870 [anaerobic digester metagenome]